MIHEIQAKTLLSHNARPDPWFKIKYGMNIYRGCQHGCIYCDSRSDCYQIANFDDVLVKVNAIERLRDELPRKRVKGVVGTGAMSDPYTYVEREYGLTGQALEVLAEMSYPAHIITKSDMVLRDIDTLADINREQAIVSITITTADDELAAKVEPGAPLPSARLAALAALSARGIVAGVTLMPVLPFIEDSLDSIRTLVLRAIDAGANYIMPAFGMTCRSGQREYFYERLDRHFDGVKAQYIATFGDSYECSSPNAPALSVMFDELVARHGIATRVPDYVPPAAPRQLPLL